jgi:hypothetical protein
MHAFVKRIKKRHREGGRTEEIPLSYTASYVGNMGNARLDFELVIGDQMLYGTDYFNLVKEMINGGYPRKYITSPILGNEEAVNIEPVVSL